MKRANVARILTTTFFFGLWWTAGPYTRHPIATGEEGGVQYKEQMLEHHHHTSKHHHKAAAMNEPSSEAPPTEALHKCFGFGINR